MSGIIHVKLHDNPGVRQALRKNGWTEAEINQMFREQAEEIAKDNKKYNPNRVVQPTVRKTSPQQTKVTPKVVEVDWYRGDTHDRMNDAIGNFNIYSAWVNSPNGAHYVIQSNKIWLKVPIMDLKEYVRGSRDEVNNLILDWRTEKIADDVLSYGKSDEELLAASKRNGYYLSEQHVVWAIGASARTNCCIPPEFFAEIEVNGGTAGNGPDVLPGGGVGQPISTIAMAHDTDWLIGRLVPKGPLGELFKFGRDPRKPLGTPSTKQNGYTRHVNLTKGSLGGMGMAGLSDSFIGSKIAPENGNISAAQKATRRAIDNFIDATKHVYRDPDSIFLSGSGTTWRVKYNKKTHADFSAAVDWGWLLPLPGVAAAAAASGAYLFENNHLDPLLHQAPNDVRKNNFIRVPYFPKGK